jgi:Vanillate O-demethylase oxygenase C-terminal domain
VVVSAAWALAGQDQVVVESQRPERGPFDLADELHLKFDAVAVACRKAMRQPGLATTDAIGHLASTHWS